MNATAQSRQIEACRTTRKAQVARLKCPFCKSPDALTREPDTSTGDLRLRRRCRRAKCGKWVDP